MEISGELSAKTKLHNKETNVYLERLRVEVEAAICVRDDILHILSQSLREGIFAVE